MTEGTLTIDRPATVTDAPTIEHDFGSRNIEALWPLRNFTSTHDGPGIQYARLSVSHLASRRGYFATLNYVEHVAGATRCKPFDAVRVGSIMPVARYSDKTLQAAFDTFLQTLRDEIAGGDRQLAAFFEPSADDEF